MRYGFLFILYGLLLSGASSCSKGVENSDPSLINLYFYNRTIDAVNCVVSVGGVPVSPYLKSGEGLGKNIVLKNDSVSMEVKAEELPAGNMLADMQFIPKLGKKETHYFTLYQSKSGEKPYWVLPVNATIPPQNGFGKLQFTYINSSMPDSIKLKFYYSDNTTPQDSCVVKRFAFSDWITVLLSGSAFIQYEVYNPVTGTLVSSKRNYPVGKSYLPLDYSVFFIDRDNFNNFLFTRMY